MSRMPGANHKGVLSSNEGHEGGAGRRDHRRAAASGSRPGGDRVGRRQPPEQPAPGHDRPGRRRLRRHRGPRRPAVRGLRREPDLRRVRQPRAQVPGRRAHRRRRGLRLGRRAGRLVRHRRRRRRRPSRRQGVRRRDLGHAPAGGRLPAASAPPARKAVLDLLRPAPGLRGHQRLRVGEQRRPGPRRPQLQPVRGARPARARARRRCRREHDPAGRQRPREPVRRDPAQRSRPARADVARARSGRQRLRRRARARRRPRQGPRVAHPGRGRHADPGGDRLHHDHGPDLRARRQHVRDRVLAHRLGDVARRRRRAGRARRHAHAAWRRPAARAAGRGGRRAGASVRLEPQRRAGTHAAQQPVPRAGRPARPHHPVPGGLSGAAAVAVAPDRRSIPGAGFEPAERSRATAFKAADFAVCPPGPASDRRALGEGSELAGRAQESPGRAEDPGKGSRCRRLLPP